jgi:hypothetical protein
MDQYKRNEPRTIGEPSSIKNDTLVEGTLPSSAMLQTSAPSPPFSSSSIRVEVLESAKNTRIPQPVKNEKKGGLFRKVWLFIVDFFSFPRFLERKRLREHSINLV